jgi:hypothetical protein
MLIAIRTLNTSITFSEVVRFLFRTLLFAISLLLNNGI